MNQIKSLRIFLWAVWIVVLDQITKFMILVYLSPYESIPIITGFNLTLVYNTGAAFSFLAHSGGWQIWALSGISLLVIVGIIVHYLRLDAAHKLYRYGLVLVLGGAVGNLIDRVFLGHVVDFIDVYYGIYHWPVFNIADSAISIGVGLLLWDCWRNT